MRNKPTAQHRSKTGVHLVVCCVKQKKTSFSILHKATKDTNPIFPVTVDLSKLMSMIETRFQTLEDNQSKMQTQIRQLEGDVAYAKSQIRDHATEIANLKHDIAKKQRAIESLENKLQLKGKSGKETELP